MLFLFIVLDSDSVCSNHYIIVVCIFWKLCVLGCNFHVEARRIFDREGLEVELTEDVYILIVYFPHCDREYLLFCLCHTFYFNYFNQIKKMIEISWGCDSKEWLVVNKNRLDHLCWGERRKKVLDLSCLRWDSLVRCWFRFSSSYPYQLINSPNYLFIYILH